MNERNNEGVCVGCWKMLYNSATNEKNSVKFLIYLYEICKWNLWIVSAVVYAVKFVNSFVNRQHLFDIEEKPIDVNSNFLS